MTEVWLFRKSTSLDVSCFRLEKTRVDHDALLRKFEIALNFDVSLRDQFKLGLRVDRKRGQVPLLTDFVA